MVPAFEESRTLVPAFEESRTVPIQVQGRVKRARYNPKGEMVTIPKIINTSTKYNLQNLFRMYTQLYDFTKRLQSFTCLLRWDRHFISMTSISYPSYVHTQLPPRMKESIPRAFSQGAMITAAIDAIQIQPYIELAIEAGSMECVTTNYNNGKLIEFVTPENQVYCKFAVYNKDMNKTRNFIYEALNTTLSRNELDREIISLYRHELVDFVEQQLCAPNMYDSIVYDIHRIFGERLHRDVLNYLCQFVDEPTNYFYLFYVKHRLDLLTGIDQLITFDQATVSIYQNVMQIRLNMVTRTIRTTTTIVTRGVAKETEKTFSMRTNTGFHQLVRDIMELLHVHWPEIISKVADYLFELYKRIK